jgi:hypothetical protein
MMANTPEPKTQVLAETEQFLAWKAEEPDEETTYHLELNNVTLHFFQEELDEFMQLVSKAEGPGGEKDMIYDVEYSNLIIQFSGDDWGEFLQMMEIVPRD